jgi:hypothetical protein
MMRYGFVRMQTATRGERWRYSGDPAGDTQNAEPTPGPTSKATEDEGKYTCPSETTANTKPPSHSAKGRKNCQNARAYKRFFSTQAEEMPKLAIPCHLPLRLIMCGNSRISGTKHSIAQSHSAVAV